MWLIWKLLVVILLFIFCCDNGFCSVAFDEQEVTQMLQTSFDCHKSNPAMAVALVKDGKVLYSHGFGYTTLSKMNPVTDETLFGIASITKSFAAALLVKLLDEKTKLTINSKVRELLGDEFVLADELRTKETTFLDMLSHKTAILGNNRIRFDPTFTRDTVLSRLRLLPSNKQFRVDYVYNNLVYGLVGRLAEIVGGHAQNKKRWEDLITEHFFEPLGMTNSTFATRINYDREDLAAAYSELDGPGEMTKVTPQLSKRWAEMCSSGSIMSSVKEMAKWLNFHLSGGQNSTGHQVMDKKLVDELHKPRLPLKSLNYLGIEKPDFPITVMETAYAMGLRVGHYRGYPLIAHTGGTYGYGTYMVMLPTENIGAIILTTGRDPSFRKRASSAHYLIDSALGIQPYLNESTICSFPKPWVDKNITSTYRPKKSNELLDFEVEEYKGMYSDKAFGDLTVTYDHNSTLKSLVMNYGWGVWEMMIWPDPAKTVNDEQRFFGKGMGPDFAPDMRPLYFVEHPHKKNTVIGLRGTAWEKSRPPIFCKKEHMTVCEALKAKTYPVDDKTSNSKPCPSNSATVHQRVAVSVFMGLSLLVFARSIDKN